MQVSASDALYSLRMTPAAGSWSSEAAVVAQPGERTNCDVAAQVARLGRRPGEPVEHPAAVLLLRGLDGVEVSLDLVLAEQAT